MDYKEEQSLEMEAMESIYEKEFKKESDTVFCLTELKPFPDDEEENHVWLTLRVTYPDTYPEVVPEWEFIDVNAIGPGQLDEINEKCKEAAEENIGMSSIYALSEVILDYLRDNNVPEMSEYDKMIQRKENPDGEAKAYAVRGLAKEESSDEELSEGEGEDVEKEWRGLDQKPLCEVGDRITHDQFDKWKLQHDKWLLSEGLIKRDDTARVTGRMHFQNKKDANGDIILDDDDLGTEESGAGG